jgi:hypothetical protein
MDAKVPACLKNNSQKGYILKRITVFTGKMNSEGFQHYFVLGVVTFINQKMPFRHRLHMDNDPKVSYEKSQDF